MYVAQVTVLSHANSNMLCQITLLLQKLSRGHVPFVYAMQLHCAIIELRNVHDISMQRVKVPCTFSYGRFHDVFVITDIFWYKL